MSEAIRDFEERFEITSTAKHIYLAKHPLTKAHPSARGVYGGNIAAQALLAAIRSAPSGFTPHSSHLYFVKNVSGEHPVEWHVEEISNGKSFCMRCVRGLQDGDVKYVANISLTKNNSLRQAEKIHNDYLEKERRRQEERLARRASGEDVDDDDDDDDEVVPDKPFHFLTPYPLWLKNVDIDALEIDHRTSLRMIYHKVPQKLVSLEGTDHEEQLPPTERRLSWFVRLGLGDVKLTRQEFQYVGLAVLSDSMFSTRLARVLRIPDMNLAEMAHYFSVSLDHTIYFHDTDFDCTEWMAFEFRAIRVVNDRFLLEGQMYNQAGHHVASVVQEGLVHFNGIEREAKI